MNNVYDAWVFDYETGTISTATAVYVDENRVIVYYDHNLTQEYNPL